MKTSVLVPISLALLAVASPLGDRAILQRHSGGTPHKHTRRYLLQSRLDSPAACAALPLSNATTTPDLSNSTIPLANTTTADDSTAVDNSTTIDPSTADNSTTVDDSTTADNSTSTDDGSTTLVRRKRFSQFDIPDIALSWQKLCLASGGDIFTIEPCVNYAGIDGINALLADARPCAQQDNADAMITFAKTAGVHNRAALIANAIAYRKHPRNTMNILGVVPSTVYCQRAPKNPELAGIVNGQLDGVDPGLFGSPNIPMMPFGSPGTCPFGQTPDVTTCTCVDGTAADASSTDVTDTATADDSTATDSATDATATDDSTANVTDTATAADATATVDDTTNTDSTAAAVTPAAAAKVAAPTASAKSNGPNFQPGDISGDVNDING